MRYDAIVIGGSFAGLSAATYIARARRSVCIIDAGAPRNRFATHSHGFLTQDGSNPGALLATARQQVAAYPTTTFIEGKAIGASGELGAFSVTLANGEVVEGARLVLAYGISDELPDLPGLKERWGKSVIHCPYCHGFEFSGQRLGVLSMSPMSVHQAMLIAEWGPTTLYLNGEPQPDDGVLAELQKRGVTIESARIRALHGEGTALSTVELTDGRMTEIDALYIGPRNHPNSHIAQQLGCESHETPFGSIIQTDDLKATTVDGVYAAGDITRGAHSVTWACSDGVMAAVALHRSLVFAAP
ncbi:thioredoxin reductase [Cupriavidus sp. HPC(L)]|uniref:NAD(P)/FAD-dependent oxidoreductase n=1 Tax=Cupriavidus sp. HPC(L) TaxID=1217418 RepID=UPI000291AD00|nr:NAD(P)/FAD-dependent oxidoreductase [Cupriavidus sp. HPC(L)]ESJ26802.1 thioredoxin reductase [Cupriavidus sp. HPC(L)]